MTLPRTTEEILAHAEELAATFESDDFDGVQLTPAEYVLYRAAKQRASAEKEVGAAVAAARDAGTSWSTIGRFIGTSGEAARQRYSA